MKRILFFASTFFLLVACKNNETTTKEAATTTVQDTPIATVDNSMNALDWEGLYKGTVPCANCDGIETTLLINKDSSFTLTLNYVGKTGAEPIEKKGMFSWNEAGNSITLGGITDGANQYLVGENSLIQLDLKGERITGTLADKYILTKQ